jgi:site-specific DNA-methyltransferase (adenine-specific)
LIEYYNEDCMVGMARYADKQFSLAIVDPPYGIGNWIPQGGKSARIDYKDHFITWNDSIPPIEYFNDLNRVSEKQIIWGANYYNCFSQSGGAVVWDKGDGNPKFSRCEIASLSFQKRVDYVSINWQSGFFRASKESIIHECQKPVALYNWLLRNYAKPGDKILDTHVGSASSLIACYDLGFDAVGFELDPDYYQASKRRLEDHMAQQRMELDLPQHEHQVIQGIISLDELEREPR